MTGLEPSFMCLPTEIRLMIYNFLFDDNGHKTLEIRNENPEFYNNRPHYRSGYRIVGRGLVRQSLPTTYRLITDLNLHAAILGVNKQIHEEASRQLYGSHVFGFGKDIEAMVPFFSDLTAQTRRLIQGISLIKHGSVYTRDYDRYEWQNICEYIKDKMQLRSMRLVVEGGRPALGWHGLPEYAVADFQELSVVKYEPLEWVWELVAIKGLRHLDIISELRYCPPSHSQAMAFFAAFSASIETEFAEFLRMEMIESE